MSKSEKKTTSFVIKDAKESITRKSIEKDGITQSIEVKKVVNGYVVYICESGYKGDKWINNDQIYISATDPFETEEESSEEKVKSFKQEVDGVLKNLKVK